MAEEYITQVIKEIHGRVTTKRSLEFSRTQSRILGALTKLNEFFLKPEVRTCSVAVPGRSRNCNSENRERTGDRSLDDLCPEALFSTCHTTNQIDSEPEETQHMVTGVQQEIPYYSPGILSGKQKKARSTSQPQFRSENTQFEKSQSTHGKTQNKLLPLSHAW